MESLRVASTGILTNRLPFKLSFKSLKYVILLASYSFLGYKLLTFHQYGDLASQWNQMPLSQFWWLAGVIFLLPLNWYLESLKWKMLTARVQSITIAASVKAVLSGISTGFFTPNRVGELVGRIAFLYPENRKAGITLSLVNSMTQNIVMALCGIPACILFFIQPTQVMQPDMVHYIWMIISGILILGFVYLLLPGISQYIGKSNLSSTLKEFTDCLSGYTLIELLRTIGISLIRYVVFCIQFYLIIRFFRIELTPLQALIAIPTTYLFVTFTPSLAFSEAAIRSSYAVLVIGTFSGQVVNIALAGVCIWAINFILPMVVGSVIMIQKSGEQVSVLK
jgi:hypothetical protein